MDQMQSPAEERKRGDRGRGQRLVTKDDIES
jgi:hypothetical protein